MRASFPRTLLISIGGAVAIGGLAFAGTVVFSGGAASSVINACVHMHNGHVRIVDAPEQCDKNERFVTWNVQGPKGDTGAVGPRGAQGDPASPARRRARLASTPPTVRTCRRPDRSTGAPG